MTYNHGALSRVKISGYKSIQSCDIALGRINVLIGGNGAGKSNLVTAFSFLQNILKKNLQVAVAQSGMNALLYRGRKETDEIAFEVYFGDHSYGLILTPASEDRPIIQKEYIGYHGASERESVIACGKCESVWNEGTHSEIDSDMIQTLE